MSVIKVQRLQVLGGNGLIARSLGITRARIVTALKLNRLGFTRHCENFIGESAIGGRTHRHRKFRITVAQLVALPKCPPPAHLLYCSAVTRCAARKSCEHNGDRHPSGRALLGGLPIRRCVGRDFDRRGIGAVSVLGAVVRDPIQEDGAYGRRNTLPCASLQPAHKSISAQPPWFRPERGWN